MSIIPFRRKSLFEERSWLFNEATKELMRKRAEKLKYDPERDSVLKNFLNKLDRISEN